MVAKAHGAGISLRREHYEDILTNNRRLDWIECNPENFMDAGVWSRTVVEKVCRDYPMFAHGVATNVGGPDPFKPDYIKILKELVDLFDCEYYSEHLCYSSAGGIEFHDLVPMPFTMAAAKHMGRRARELQDKLNRPLVLENISYYCEMPTSEMTEGEFITEVLNQFDGGLLLDVNNIFVNSVNFNRSPRDMLRELPLHRARHIHLAGHRRYEDMAIDDHGHACIPEVWALYREAIELCGRPVPTMIEWENNTPSWDRLLEEADTARFHQEDVMAKKHAKQVEQGVTT